MTDADRQLLREVRDLLRAVAPLLKIDTGLPATGSSDVLSDRDLALIGAHVDPVAAIRAHNEKVRKAQQRNVKRRA